MGSPVDCLTASEFLPGVGTARSGDKPAHSAFSSDMTWITVRLFASARELAGAPSLRLPASQGLTVGKLRAELGKAFPPLIPLLEKSAFAVNRRYVTDAEPLAPEDEVAVIPPVAGG